MHAHRQMLGIAAAAALLGFGAASSAHAEPSKAIVAVFSEDDPQFSETITLYADGKYQQAETEKKASLYGPASTHSYTLPDWNVPGRSTPGKFGDPKRTGAWRVLNKGGQPLAFKTLASLPKDAVIEVKGAMPFGITWERQLPYFSHGDRTLPAASFQAAPPAPSKK